MCIGPLCFLKIQVLFNFMTLDSSVNAVPPSLCIGMLQQDPYFKGISINPLLFLNFTLQMSIHFVS